MLSRFSIRTILIGSALCVAGCTHSLIYNENRDQQGQDAVAAVEAVQLRAIVETAETALTELAAREEANARALQADLFDREVTLIARAGSLEAVFDEAGEPDSENANGLVTVLESRFTELGGAADSVDELIVISAERDAEVDTQTVGMIELRGIAGVDVRNCQALLAASANLEVPDGSPSARFLSQIPSSAREEAAALFADLIASCQRMADLSGRIRASFSGGEIGRYAAELEELENGIRSHEEAKRRARDAVDSAVSTFAGSGLRPTDDMSRSELQDLEERAESLAATIAELSALRQNLLPNAEVVSAEMLERLQSLLAAIAGMPEGDESGLDAEDQVNIAFVRALPALRDEARELFNGARQPRLVPYLAAIEYHRIVLEGFEASEGIKRRQVDAARERLSAAINEGVAIADVLRLLDDSWSQQSIASLDRTLGSEDKAVFYRALAIYADDVRRFRSDADVWGARLDAVRYEESLSRSKYAAAQWDSLLRSVVRVLSDYHGAGIRSEDLTGLAQAAGLVTIGVGAAQ